MYYFIHELDNGGLDSTLYTGLIGYEKVSKNEWVMCFYVIRSMELLKKVVKL